MVEKLASVNRKTERPAIGTLQFKALLPPSSDPAIVVMLNHGKRNRKKNGMRSIVFPKSKVGPQ